MTSFGKYQVVELIGQGGFGRVYKAWDPALKRHVAVKTCSLQDADMRARFGREAEIAGNLRHPHIVTVYDYGHEDGEPYLVQEYLEGEDLDHKLKRGDTFALDQLLEWLRQTAEGLEYAHRHGVLHRDVKPANIRVLPAGDVRIMDFGIAKLLEEDRQLTRTGMSVGTAGYLAPEQLMGLDVDHRADIFSFGAMAYELVSGRKPFDADSFTAILFRIAHEEPTPLPLVAPGSDPRLVALIERCLRKSAADRYADFGAIVAELRDIAASPHASAAAAGGGGATMAFAGGVPAAAEAEASSPVASGTPAAAEPLPGTRRRRLSPAAWGLVAATVVVAGFGVMSISDVGRTANADRSESSPVDAAADPAGAGTVAAPMPETGTAALDQAVAGARADGQAVDPQPGGAAGPRATAGGVAVPGGGAAADAAGSGSAAGASAGAQGTSPARAAASALSASRVVVLVAGSTREVADAAETTLISALQEAGFDVRDAELISGSDAARAVAAQTGSLLGMGRAAGAATVIVAEVSADARQIVAGMFSGSAAVTLRMYGAAGGDLIATERFEIGSPQAPGEAGPTPLAAATAATRAASFQAARSAVRRLNARR